MLNELTRKEYGVMKLIWENNDGISFSELCEYARLENSSVHPQTINTYLIHLIKKNFVKAEGIRRKRIYYPLVSRTEYDNFLARRIVKELFDGSLKNFVSAFTLNEGLTERETIALKALLRKKGE